MKGFIQAAKYLTVLGWGWLLGAVFFPPIHHKGQYSLTCYNNALEITYMSPDDLYSRSSRPNEYGVWYLSDNSTYIQNSGDTCVASKITATVTNTDKVEQ